MNFLLGGLGLLHCFPFAVRKGCMNLEIILSALKRERDHIDRAVAALEGIGSQCISRRDRPRSQPRYAVREGP